MTNGSKAQMQAISSYQKPDWSEIGGPKFTERTRHRRWLMGQASDLLDFFQPQAMNPKGGFFALDNVGNPLPTPVGNSGCERQLHETTRMVHCFAIAKLTQRAGADDIIDHGMDFLWNRHRDTINGGYFWGVDDHASTNPLKQAYGHAFVLLAGASAKAAGHPDADRLLADVTEVLLTRFWEPEFGVTSEEYTADWKTISDYRGHNSNMHLTESLMAAYEVTKDQTYLDMALSASEMIINRHARAQDWSVPEHFDAKWRVDLNYRGDPIFRPHGITPGHGLEWARLLVQLWEMDGRQHKWLAKAAKHLFRRAVETGWAGDTGGFYYTLDWDYTPEHSNRFWWPCAEGVSAAAALASIDEDPYFETWYRRIWGFVDAHLIDHQNGGWFPELTDDLRPVAGVFSGKPDIYHALQACLIPLVPSTGSITRGLNAGQINLRKPS